MKNSDDKDMNDLELRLAKEAEWSAGVPRGLLQRVLADADAVQAGQMQVNTIQSPGPLKLMQTLLPGGWAGLGGLVAATCAGFWIGVSPPAMFPDAALAVFGTQTETDWNDPVNLAGFGWITEEE